MTNVNAAGLRSARVKLQRAKDHVANLRLQRDGWASRKPYFLDTDVKSEPGKILFKIHTREEIPDQFAAILGDIIHNLRSALDHLAWALVERNGNTPNERTQFPIGYDLQSLDKNGWSGTAGMSDEAIQAIKKLQPYKGGYGKPGNEILWSIHDLDRIDKHRLLVPVGAAHTASEMRFCVGVYGHRNFKWIGPPIVDANRPLAVPVKDGETVAEVISTGMHFPPEVNLNCRLSFNVHFGEGSSVAMQPLAEVLPIMGKHIERIVNQFEGRFFS